ncbi:MAG: ABC transporter permease [Aggregatilineales bacterium]
MTDIPMNAETAESPVSLQETGQWLRTVVTFVVVLGAVVIIWQLVKAFFHLDGIKLPNVSDVIGALFQPLQSGDPGQPNPPALGVLLINASVYTMREAAVGFVLGSTLGFALAVIFAHSRLLERGLMPFVVASQMVPILAIAPMVVIWLGPTAENIGVEWAPVAVIAAYLTFFPVTINTLRGLLSVPATAVELMQSYAATRREILFKLRVPHALPYIFTALKVSATASVVGTIIGELPSGIQHGLGSDILNFSQYYASGPPRLWATNLAAALCGILAFVVVAVTERLIVRWTPSEQ